jgi:predicted esterase
MRATNTTRLSAISGALVASVMTMLMSGPVLAEEENVVWDHMDVPYGVDDPGRQFLNIYLANTTEPAPVYLFSHDNSKTAYDFLQNDADNVHDQGYTLVSWESIVQLNSNPQSLLTAWSDAQVAFDWVRANAAAYNMDPDRIVIAGRSRGSIASWPLAHSGHAAIQGIYMYNALPNYLGTRRSMVTGE